MAHTMKSTLDSKHPDFVAHAQVYDVREALPNDPSQAGNRWSVGLAENIVSQEGFEEAVLVGLSMAKDRHSKHNLHDSKGLHST